MKFLGLVYALSLCLCIISASPAFFTDPISTIALSGSSLVLTGASGATLATVPVASLLLGKALLVKKAILLKALADRAAAENAGRR